MPPEPEPTQPQAPLAAPAEPEVRPAADDPEHQHVAGDEPVVEDPPDPVLHLDLF